MVGDNTSDAAVAVKKRMNTDKTIMETCEKAADFVDIGGLDAANGIAELPSKGIKLIVNFGAAVWNAVNIFISRRAEAHIVASGAKLAGLAVGIVKKCAMFPFPIFNPVACASAR